VRPSGRAYDYSVTQLIEDLAASRECAVAAKLSGRALERHRAASYEDGAWCLLLQASSSRHESFPCMHGWLSMAFVVPYPYDLPPGRFSRGLAPRMIA
jgi:hypothetical protein